MAISAQSELRPLTATLERQRWQAMVDRDLKTLLALLSDELVCVHSSESIDDKTSYLIKVNSDSTLYHGAQSDFERIVALGLDSFTAGGSVKIDATVGEIRKQLDCFVSVTWRHRGGRLATVSASHRAIPEHPPTPIDSRFSPMNNLNRALIP